MDGKKLTPDEVYNRMSTAGKIVVFILTPLIAVAAIIAFFHGVGRAIYRAMR